MNKLTSFSIFHFYPEKFIAYSDEGIIITWWVQFKHKLSWQLNISNYLMNWLVVISSGKLIASVYHNIFSLSSINFFFLRAGGNKNK